MSLTTRVLLISITAVALAGGGFAAGRYAAPDKVVTKDREVTVYVDRAVSSVDTDKILNAIKSISEQKDVHTVKKTEKRPDGSVTTTVETEDKTKTDTKTETQDKEHKAEVQIVEKLVYKDHETIKTIERNRPQWSLSLMPGLDVAGVLGHSQPYNLFPSQNYLLKHAIIGMSIERRILGPVSAGLWMNSAGMAGLTFRLEF